MASSPRATGPVSAASAPVAAQFSARRGRAGRAVARSRPRWRRAARPGPPASRGSSRRSRRRRGRRRGPRRRPRRAACRGRGERARRCRARARWCRPRRTPRPRTAPRRPLGPSSAGAGREALAVAERLERRGAGAVADERPRREPRRGSRDLPVGNGQEHDLRRGRAPRPSGPSTSIPAARSAEARAWPSRPAPTMAQRSGVDPEAIRSSSRTRYRLGDGGGSGFEVTRGGDGLAPDDTPQGRIPRRRRVNPGMPGAEERREELKAVFRQASVCTRCPQLASTRQTVVFGSGNADADLMFVGEAPGANEDKQGVPFVGQAGKLLEHAAERDRPGARGRLHRQRPEVPSSRQPRPAAAGDRQLPGLPVPPARADRAEGGLHARELLHEAPARRPVDGHHRAPRPRGDPRHRATRGPALPDLPPGRRALHALAARHAARRLRAPAGAARPGSAAPAAAAGRARAGSSRSPSWSRRSRGAEEPAESQLGLF